MSAKITILKSRFSNIGGAEKHAARLAEAFSEKGCYVTVLTTEAQIDNPSYDVVSFLLKSHTSVSKLWEFDSICEDFLKRSQPDIIFGLDRNLHQTHIRAGSGVHRAYLEKRKQMEPFVLQLRHMLNPLHRSLLHFEKTAFESPALQTLFTNSHMVKNEILDSYNVDPDIISVIHNGVEWKSWQEAFDSYEEHHDPDTFTFLFIGNDFKRKGLARILKGLSLLSMRDFRLLVVGKDKKMAQFKRLAAKLDLEEQVQFLDQKSEATPFYKMADCLLIPSFYDPFANVTVEALSMGLFVVSSKSNGGSEVLTEETGLIIEDLFDDESVKNALEKALKHPKTGKSAQKIRNQVKYLDFSHQLEKYVDQTLCSPICC